MTTEERGKWVEENMGFIKSLVNKYYNINPEEEWDDLYSLALFSFEKAAASFKNDKGANFLTYYHNIYRNECLLLKKKNNTRIRIAERASLSLDDTYKTGDGEASTVQDLIADATINIEAEAVEPKMEELLRNLKRRLTERQCQILMMLLDGKKQKQIAEELGIKQPQVNRDVKSLRERASYILGVKR